MNDYLLNGLISAAVKSCISYYSKTIHENMDKLFNKY